ncbi:hypothetical protein PVAP13_3NG194703 [Panicum virgatum]|uniref:Vesicle transport v-SNARE N-terminal domain-containing protein n=1 Tax=Panicum virgatum TaxID=38727 RepID=A0A8T0U696_PANVG|nr:hypothetical protein PVAP13_3NG194703 [Panicum virgatum]
MSSSSPAPSSSTSAPSFGRVGPLDPARVSYFSAGAAVTTGLCARENFEGFNPVGHLDRDQKLKQKAAEIKSGIDGAEALIRKMDLEARNLQPSVRAGRQLG